VREIVPPPNRLTQVTLVRSIDEELSTQPQQAQRGYYYDHPEVVPIANSPRRSERWVGLFAKNLELDRRVKPLVKQQEGVGELQAKLVRPFAFLSPSVALTLLLEQWAGTDFERNNSFIEQVDSFQEEWRAFFGPKIMALATLHPDDYERFPVFRFHEEETATFYMRAILPFLALVALTFAAIGLFSRAALKGAQAILRDTAR